LAAAEREKKRAGARARPSGRAASSFCWIRERDLEELSKARAACSRACKLEPKPCTSEELLGLGGLTTCATDTKHARALDAVLGLRGSALVARDREARSKSPLGSKSSEAGQVGLVLPRGIATPIPRTEEELGGEDEALVEGRLRDSVRCAAGFRALAESLVRRRLGPCAISPVRSSSSNAHPRRRLRDARG